MKRELHPITGKAKMVARPDNYRESANRTTSSLNTSRKSSHPLNGTVDARRPFSAPVGCGSNVSTSAAPHPQHIRNVEGDGSSDHCGAEARPSMNAALNSPSEIHSRGYNAFSSPLNSKDRGKSVSRYRTAFIFQVGRK